MFQLGTRPSNLHEQFVITAGYVGFNGAKVKLGEVLALQGQEFQEVLGEDAGRLSFAQSRQGAEVQVGQALNTEHGRQ